MPLVLDTNIVRHLGEGEIDPIGLRLLRSEGVSIHLPEAGFIEFLLQLRQGRFPWDRWLRARRILVAILSHREPITLGCDFDGRRHPYASSRSDVHAADSPEYRTFVRRIWKSVIRARTANEIGVGVRRGATILPALTVERLAEHVTMAKASWMGAFESVRPLGTIPTHDLGDRFEELARQLAESIDARVPGDPHESTKWDAVIRILALFAVRTLKQKAAYNAHKNANDAFDHDLLRYFAVPAAICTRDRPLLAALRESGSWQAKWAVAPEELLDPTTRKRLSALAWPVAR